MFSVSLFSFVNMASQSSKTGSDNILKAAEDKQMENEEQFKTPEISSDDAELDDLLDSEITHLLTLVFSFTTCMRSFDNHRFFIISYYRNCAPTSRDYYLPGYLPGSAETEYPPSRPWSQRTSIHE